MVTAIALLATLTASPASAAQKWFDDAVGDVKEQHVDVRSVKVKHQKNRITVAVSFAELPKEDYSDSLRVYIDTSKKKGPPNYLVASEGFHGVFGSTSGWKLRPNGEDPWGDVMCSTGYKYDRANDRIIFRFKPKCIGSPKKIRVAVTAEHYYEANADGTLNTVKDHLHGRRHFTSWVKR